MVRRLCSHIVHHSKARSTLSELHKLFTGMPVGSLESLRYVPHRFLSHAEPAAKLADNYFDILVYVNVALYEHRVEVRGRDGRRT